MTKQAHASHSASIPPHKEVGVVDSLAELVLDLHGKHIAEAPDAAAAYEVGSFSQRGWAEWSGRYRDDIRRFWRGDDGMLGSFASRICGSTDIYAKSDKCPKCRINFVTCHDGFTLNDQASHRGNPLASHSRAILVVRAPSELHRRETT